MLSYKFVIAPGNSRGDGYVTEMLFEAHLGGAIPIFWGAEMLPEPRILNPLRILFFNGSNVEELLQRARSLVTNSSAREEVSRTRLLFPPLRLLLKPCAMIMQKRFGWVASSSVNATHGDAVQRSR